MGHPEETVLRTLCFASVVSHKTVFSVFFVVFGVGVGRGVRGVGVGRGVP